MEIWEPKPPGTPWATLGLLQDSFLFYTIVYTLHNRDDDDDDDNNNNNDNSNNKSP